MTADGRNVGSGEGEGEGAGKIKPQLTCAASPRRDAGTRESRRLEVSHLAGRRDQASRDCAI